METTIQKWGNSLAVRLPQHIAQKLALKQGSHVKVSEEKKMIIIRRTLKSHTPLKELVAMIRPKNIHTEINWGKSQGKEIW
ncbi:MAG: AbrB/MazE/SpoVT family DNA-binding domain-containing protein [Candidatus Sungbacteria bacterium]|nr:AbrB/MazE/SpoVT family DNA-binding domain-containing protein [bacterium]MDZ4260583.1 AbrB/MazE/SpoVT family DNA-binding domain-containing protein [Candidatus Sungbacteria bacterium]